ncbi:MAG: hypothetical protein GWN61_04860, partial [candidate division Zixibacteria bacterium]|nr:hypothetical protein [candidate division Zixibacteria bacterium]NIS45371.1 hypothetical protein [candidate division Zixibacteria bacterium]NIU13490.1 hypothetical protein [candidate division Zixibacteria bacterium]NIV05525.1 hypothetical protein [candidate division Zixibacteria bacterium]NIW44306.1 hypothetical protein [Gammaproteobacteria bacterium]
PLAARIAAEHKLDSSQIKPQGGRIEKADVLAYLQNIANKQNLPREKPKRTLASPKARRIADDHGIDIRQLTGSGPQGAVISDDVLSQIGVQPAQVGDLPTGQLETEMSLSTTWNRMVERISGSWPTTPHFYLMKEVNASRLISWRESIQGKTDEKITFTDLLVKLTANALKQHPKINSHFADGNLIVSQEINIGLAVAIDDGLIVPVIHRADSLTINQIAQSRIELVKKAQRGRLDLKDLQNGTFTISNLGMYGVDAFNAVLNPPQSAILAVG